MATVTRSAAASVDATTAQLAPQITGLVSGAAIGPMMPCEIRADGKVYPASAAAADSHAVIAGWCPKNIPGANIPVTLYGVGLVGKISDELLTPGQKLYLSATVAGGLDTAATTGDAVGCAQAIDTSNIRVTRNI